jgi:cell division protein FtsW
MVKSLISNTKKIYLFDKWLLLCTTIIILFGLVMVLSASLPLTQRIQVATFYFAKNQALYIFLGICLFFITTKIPTSLLQKYSNYILLFAMLLLLIVLLPGVSKPINGSVRWLRLGFITVQPSEIAKLALIIYIAGYMVRRFDKLITLQGFINPMLVLASVALLLMLEPDFGSVVVIATTTLGMLYLGGVKSKHFLILVPLCLCVVLFMAVSSSYRIQRIISFRDPWASQYDSGYQLVQSLIAFGKGSWFGQGLGSSVQKLLYLPESHSDFILAIIGEELGLVGVVFLLFLYCFFCYKAMDIGRKACMREAKFAGNLAYGIGLFITIQALINFGVNIGLLPTKGLTLPLMSAGGSSIIVVLVAIGILFRVDFENKKA